MSDIIFAKRYDLNVLITPQMSDTNINISNNRYALELNFIPAMVIPSFENDNQTFDDNLLLFYQTAKL